MLRTALRWTTCVLLSAAVGLVVVTTDGDASASVRVSQAYTVPGDRVLDVTGHGWGHGHGMSQYGAKGAAQSGLTAAQILAFYYPGTRLAASTGPLRVKITADSDRDTRVSPASGLAVRDVRTGSSYRLPTSSATGAPREWRLQVWDGKTRLAYRTGAWHRLRSFAGAAEFHGPAATTLRLPSGTARYRGILRHDAGLTINVIALDTYVRGVVPREMPTSWPAAAVQAQAVAARTYAAWERAANPRRSWHTCDTTSCQVYGGLGAESSGGNAAVSATAAKVLTYQGVPAFTQFSSSSGGWTSAGGPPYLPSKADRYDAVSGNPNHTWRTTVSAASIQRSWPSLGTLRRVVVTQREGGGEWQGRVQSMVLDGSRGDVTVSGDTFRSRFGLKSSWFAFG